MAFSVRIQGSPRDSGQPIWSHEPAWWKYRQLMADPRFREVRCPKTGYVDYVAVLTVEEALALQEKYAPDAFDWMVAEAKKLGELLARSKPPAVNWILVNVFEWESGR